MKARDVVRGHARIINRGTVGPWTVRERSGELAVWAKGIEVAAYIGRADDPNAVEDAALIVEARNTAPRVAAALGAAIDALTGHSHRRGDPTPCVACAALEAIDREVFQ